MRSKISSGLRLFALFTAVLIFSTGCTFFGRTDKNEPPEKSEEELVLEKTRSATLIIVDQSSEETEVPLTFIEGENVYEILNKLMFSEVDWQFEFDHYQVNNQGEIMVTSVNGYNPSEDELSWVLKVNGQTSPNGLLETRPREGDAISLELERNQP